LSISLLQKYLNVLAMRWDEEAVKWWWQKDEKLDGFTVVYKGSCKPRCKPEIHMNATVNVICYKQKTLSNGEHPLMLREAPITRQ